ncbi:MAG: ABC transporter permease subunit [Beijerinckiaceae bacterium]|nr:ABC transporter permease subunit [Beijerinckiaceae bacterium]
MNFYSFRPASLDRDHPLNVWDILAALLILGLLAAFALGARNAGASLDQLQRSPITLDPLALPEYAARTTLRMFAAMTISFAFTLVYATIAAKNRRAELILIPLLDILQSVPILGFLTFTVVFFMQLFPGRVLGAECAAVFAIFTSQAWNMTFSLYQSLKTVPGDLREATRSFRLSPLQTFWTLELPFAAPGLVWNAMISMSGGWFFIVAAEAITVGDTTITLPGIGSYVALAIQQQDLGAIGYAIVAMLLVIFLYDQLLFRPIVAWADKFRIDQTAASLPPSSWVLDLFRRTRGLRLLVTPIASLVRACAIIRLPWRKPSRPHTGVVRTRSGDAIFAASIGLFALASLYALYRSFGEGLSLEDVSLAFRLALVTLIRVIVLIVLASLIWVPIGVWIGLRPRMATLVQPIAQFLAAFPANIAFPAAVYLIVSHQGDPDIWLSPLIILGTQWYILFNVIAGTLALPGDLKDAATSLQLSGWTWWRRIIIPGILPHYVTGAITASGGSWNASIVAEVASWGDTRLTANGLGAYIAQATESGDYARVMLGIAMMSAFVVVFNRLVWRPLYDRAARHAVTG